jgi:hypothetical protein
MSALIRLILRTTDLVEAQSRSVRRAIGEIALSFALMLAAAGLGLIMCLTAAAAIALALAQTMPLPAALAFVAGLLGLCAMVTGIVAVRLSTPRWPRR